MVSGTPKETKREGEGEEGESEANKKLGGLAAGFKQRSLDFESSPESKRAQR